MSLVELYNENYMASTLAYMPGRDVPLWMMYYHELLNVIRPRDVTWLQQKVFGSASDQMWTFLIKKADLNLDHFDGFKRKQECETIQTQTQIHKWKRAFFEAMKSSKAIIAGGCAMHIWHMWNSHRSPSENDLRYYFSNLCHDIDIFVPVQVNEEVTFDHRDGITTANWLVDAQGRGLSITKMTTTSPLRSEDETGTSNDTTDPSSSTLPSQTVASRTHPLLRCARPMRVIGTSHYTTSFGNQHPRRACMQVLQTSSDQKVPMSFILMGVPNGEIVNSQPPNGEILNSQPANGESFNSQPANGESFNSQPANGESTAASSAQTDTSSATSSATSIQSWMSAIMPVSSRPLEDMSDIDISSSSTQLGKWILHGFDLDICKIGWVADPDHDMCWKPVIPHEHVHSVTHKQCLFPKVDGCIHKITERVNKYRGRGYTICAPDKKFVDAQVLRCSRSCMVEKEKNPDQEPNYVKHTQSHQIKKPVWRCKNSDSVEYEWMKRCLKSDCPYGSNGTQEKHLHVFENGKEKVFVNTFYEHFDRHTGELKPNGHSDQLDSF